MMSIVKVHPQKEGALWILAQPRQGVRHYRSGTPFIRLVAILSEMPDLVSGVVGIESAPEAARKLFLGIEHDGAHKSRRTIPQTVQDFRRIRQLLREWRL